MALTDSLISWWKLDETSDGSGAVTRNDSHGTNHLTDSTTVPSATGKVGNGADFEASASDYLNIASNSTLQMGDIDCTFCCWLKLETVSGSTQDFLTKDDASSSREYHIGFNGTNFRVIVWDAATGLSLTQRVATTFGAPSSGAWIFVVAWHDSAANTLNIQINNGTVDSTSTSAGVRVSTAPFRLGNRGNAASPMDGVMDMVGIWKRVLTSDERTQLYNGGSGLDYPFGGEARLVGNSPLIKSCRLHSKLLGA